MQYTRIGNLVQGENFRMGCLTRTSQTRLMHEHELRELVECQEGKGVFSMRFVLFVSVIKVLRFILNFDEH
jgi:hypothetical protein